jgi:hypothetical protein
MKAKSIKGKSTEAVKQALQNSLADGFLPTIAPLFISVKQDRKAICEFFNSRNIDVFGTTSCGEFTDGHQSEGEIVVLLLELAKENQIIISEDCYEKVKESFKCEKVGSINLKNKANSMTIYEVIE